MCILCAHFTPSTWLIMAVSPSSAVIFWEETKALPEAKSPVHFSITWRNNNVEMTTPGGFFFKANEASWMSPFSSFIASWNSNRVQTVLLGPFTLPKWGSADQSNDILVCGPLCSACAHIEVHDRDLPCSSQYYVALYTCPWDTTQQQNCIKCSTAPPSLAMVLRATKRPSGKGFELKLAWSFMTFQEDPKERSKESSSTSFLDLWIHKSQEWGTSLQVEYLKAT